MPISAPAIVLIGVVRLLTGRAPRARAVSADLEEVSAQCGNVRTNRQNTAISGVQCRTKPDVAGACRECSDRHSRGGKTGSRAPAGRRDRVADGHQRVVVLPIGNVGVRDRCSAVPEDSDK